MEKSKEIEILQSLKGDTNFQDFFGAHDIDQMCENIRNDFGIEYCCQFYQKAAIVELVRGLIVDFDGEIPNEMYDRLVNAVGQLFIINFKREREYPLTEAEIDWLVKAVNK